MIHIMGALVHWRAHTERIVIQSPAAGEYIALSRGNTAAKFVRDILIFYGNGNPNYFLFTDNQAAEHIATQPNMNDHSRSIDIRHHAIRQDYVNGEMRIGGVATQDNTSDILTKNLQPPLRIKPARELNILQQPTQTNLTNCVIGITSRGSHRTNTTRNCSLTHTHQLSLDPPMESNRPRVLANQQNRNKTSAGQSGSVLPATAKPIHLRNITSTAAIDTPVGMVSKAALAHSRKSSIKRTSCQEAGCRTVIGILRSNNKTK
jgi:hypothetical protein